MASAITHAVCGGALGVALFPGRWWPRPVVVAAVVACLPDLDVLGYQLGVPYHHMCGHRGISHSLAFALASAVAAWFVSFGAEPWTRQRGRVLALLLTAALSHPLFDMMTDGGLGIALWAPFSGERHFLGWRPVAVSPLSPAAFFSARGLRVLQTEGTWLLLPWISVCLVIGRHTRRRHPSMRDPAPGDHP